MNCYELDGQIVQVVQLHVPGNVGTSTGSVLSTTSTSYVDFLTKAITKGGTTLRDYVSGDGLPGYFANELKVYNRSGELCSKCKKKIKTIKQNQRSTFYCAFCQT